MLKDLVEATIPEICGSWTVKHEPIVQQKGLECDVHVVINAIPLMNE